MGDIEWSTRTRTYLLSSRRPVPSTGGHSSCGIGMAVHSVGPRLYWAVIYYANKQHHQTTHSGSGHMHRSRKGIPSHTIQQSHNHRKLRLTFHQHTVQRPTRVTVDGWLVGRLVGRRGRRGCLKWTMGEFNYLRLPSKLALYSPFAGSVAWTVID